MSMFISIPVIKDKRLIKVVKPQYDIDFADDRPWLLQGAIYASATFCIKFKETGFCLFR